MGDSGSYLLGYMMALLSLWVCEKPNYSISLLPLLILAVPIIYTSFAMLRRFLNGIPFYLADKDHHHHRLIAKEMAAS
jgi:UDP-GlcNAc:undecaprenyl-phosphate GlcNAc-1-phosphate transferase